MGGWMTVVAGAKEVFLPPATGIQYALEVFSTFSPTRIARLLHQAADSSPPSRLV